MSKYKVTPYSLKDLSMISLQRRKSNVQIKDFAKVLAPERAFSRFIQSLPDVLAGGDFKEFISLMKKAKEKKKAIIFGRTLILKLLCMLTKNGMKNSLNVCAVCLPLLCGTKDASSFCLPVTESVRNHCTICRMKTE